MSTPTSEDDIHDSVTSSLLLTTAMSSTPVAEQNSCTSSELDMLLEKQLLLEKTRVGELANDNQRLLSQNISLCQAIKQQKQEIDKLSRDRYKLQQQVSKLFLSVTTLNKTHQTSSAQDSATHRSLKNEFDVLKNALAEKEATNRKLLLSLNMSAKQINQKNEEICGLKQELSALNTNHDCDKAEYERIIAEHTSSIEECNAAIHALKTAMSEKQSEIESLRAENGNLGRQWRESEDRNDTAQAQILSLSEQLRNIENLCRETTEKRNAEHSEYEASMKENGWWKSEAVALDKECRHSVDKLSTLKFEIYSSSQMDAKACINKYRSLQWKHFAQYLMHKSTVEQLTDVWSYLKTKYAKRSQHHRNVQPLQESFKIALLRSLKGVESIDLDQLLLCADVNQLKQFFTTSDMSPKLQLTVAAQLLPVVENYRIELQQHINAKIDKIIDQRQSGQTSNNALSFPT